MGQSATHGEQDRGVVNCCKDTTDSAASSRQDKCQNTVNVTLPGASATHGDMDEEPCDARAVAAEAAGDGSAGNGHAEPSPQSPAKPPRQRSRAFAPTSSFACSFAQPAGPEVKVIQISPRSAAVSWRYASKPKVEIRRWHLEVIHAAGKSKREVGFWETPGSDSSFELPEGTLERNSGPFCIQVAYESGPEGDGAVFSRPGVSLGFWTPPEAPSGVVWPRLAEPPTESRICVEWDVPEDNGGCSLKEYKISLCKDTPMDSGKILDANAVSVINTWYTSKTSHTIDDLLPGAGPYRVEVCSTNSADLTSPPMCLDQVRTAVVEPGHPTCVRAQLKPVLTSRWGDADVIRIDFVAPVYDGGQPLTHFQVSTLENQDPDMPQKSKSLRHVREVPVAEAAQGDGNGCACSCEVEVTPNEAHTFVVQAFNGERMSCPSEPTLAVFVPARVPPPPFNPPEVRAEQGGIAELTWECIGNGGGLPILSFKVGIMRCSDRFDLDVREVSREVTVLRAAALRHAYVDLGEDDEGEPLLGSDKSQEKQSVWGTRVDGLEADTRYRFVIAASNVLGTGCYSAPSAPVSTPVAAPASPANPVATVALDAQRRTVVNVAWEPGHMRVGSGAVIAFHLSLTLVEQEHTLGTKIEKLAWGKASKGQEWQCGKVLYERLAVDNLNSMPRMTWSAPLMLPGSYKVEVTSENTMGQRSSPTTLMINASPEAFAPPEQTPQAPHWADEPYMIRGAAEKNEKSLEVSSATNERRFMAHVDGDDRQWLQALLLWEGNATAGKKTDPWSASTASSSVDVLCFYRRPDYGPAEAQLAVLGKAITSSRLQASLPVLVPMSLRLAARTDPTSSGACPAPRSHSDMPQSEPLLLLLSEEGRQLSSRWEVWSRQSANGKPPSWTPLPEAMHVWVETAWVEGKPTVEFTIPCKSKGASASSKDDTSDDCCALSHGLYQIQFGDERSIQHTVKRLGPGGWNAKARRIVSGSDGEDEAEKTAMPADDQCVICMERRRTHAFMHADTGDGHLAVCGNCAETFRAEIAAGTASQALRTCPMCRRPFQTLQRIFQ